jgi:hypothetical protein
MANLGSKRQKKTAFGGKRNLPKYTSARKLLSDQPLAPPMVILRLDLAHKIIEFPNPAAYTESPLHGFVGTTRAGSRRTP